MRKACFTFVCFLTGLLSANAFAADKIPLKLTLQPGMSWSFDQTQDSASDNTASVNGQSQTFSTKGQSHRSGKVEIVAVKNGTPSSLKVTYDDTCQTINESAGQQMKVPFPYAGKTITVTKADDGTVTDDFNDQADPQSIAELHETIEQEQAMFPKDPVGIGDEWPGDAPSLARTLDLQGPNDHAGMTLKLLSVKNIDGRPTAEVKVSVAVIKDQQGIQVKVISQGTALVDIQTGHALKVDLKGTTTAAGDQSGPGPNGQQVSYHIEGKGTLTSTETSPFISAGSAATPLAMTPSNTPAPSDNPLAPAPADPFSGSFSDGQLTVDWSAAADGYTGTLTLGDKKFPASAQRVGQKLSGSFDSGGNKFPFTATLDGDTLNFATGSKTYTLKKAAANPLDAPAAPANPLTPGASTGGAADALAAYTTVNATDAGKALAINRPEITSVEAGLTATYKDLVKYFDAAPKMQGAYEDQKDHRSAGASFTAKLKGQPVSGLINCKLGDKGTSIAVIYCRADAPREEWAKLTAAPQAADQAGAAPSQVQLQTYTFPDGTGSIGLAPGWATQAQTCASTVELKGPNDETVVIGLIFSVVTPDSTAVQMQRELEANARQMGLPPPPPMQLFVAPYTDPVNALKDLLPQLSVASQHNGGPAFKLTKILSAQNAPSSLPSGSAAVISFNYINADRRGSAPYKEVAQVEIAPVGQGTWMFYSIAGFGPEANFDHDQPAMLAMIKSLDVNQQVLNQKMQEHRDAQNQQFAAMQAAHQEQIASFDAYRKDQDRNANIRDRSFADMDETIVGSRDVLDTATGQRTSVNLGDVDGVVNRLNEGDPGRYQQIPLRDEMFPVPQN